MTDHRLPDDWVVVAECSSGSEASLVEGRLRQEGIETQALAARGAPGAWLTGAQADWAPKVIAVPLLQRELALSLLAETDGDPGPIDDEVVEEPDPADFADTPDDEIYAAPSTFMGFVRASAGVVALILALGLAWAQCSS